MTAGPTAEVTDWVQIDGGKYHEVTGIFRTTGNPRVHTRGHGVWHPDQITDVYTKAEQEANGALVQFTLGDRSIFKVADVVGDTGLVAYYRESVFGFLTPEATATLGEFQPVPERDIVPGDCVRDDRLDAVYIWKSHHRPDHRVSLVAREDPAFIAPPVIKEQGDGTPNLSDLANELVSGLPPLAKAAVGLCKLLAGYDPAPTVIKEPEPAPNYAPTLAQAEQIVADMVQPTPNTGTCCKAGREAHPESCPVHGTHEGGRSLLAAAIEKSMVHPEPAPPVIKYCSCPEKTPDCPDHNASPVIKDLEPAPVCGEPVGAGTYGCPSVYGPPPACMLAAGHDGQHEPDPAPPIPEAWDLVQAGDGHLYRAGKRRPGGRYWSRADRNDLLSMPGAELPRPVRRAVVVTLPDEWHSDYQEFVEDMGAEASKRHAAELVAAALHAEEGEK